MLTGGGGFKAVWGWGADSKEQRKERTDRKSVRGGILSRFACCSGPLSRTPEGGGVSLK